MWKGSSYRYLTASDVVNQVRKFAIEQLEDKIITDPSVPEEDARLLDKVMRDPFQVGVMLDLMFNDLSTPTQRRKKKVKRGIGSY